jgi:hypothetical protein
MGQILPRDIGAGFSKLFQLLALLVWKPACNVVSVDHLTVIQSHSGGPMNRDQTKDWRELCKAAAQELDPAKLTDIIAELIKTLDERDRKRRNTTGENAGDNDGGSRSLRSEPAMG